MKQSKFPPGWDEARVNRVLAHYESQSEAEALAEDEAALRSLLDLTRSTQRLTRRSRGPAKDAG